MSCIGAALETGNDIIVGSKIIDDLSFSFIAPLKAKNTSTIYMSCVMNVERGKNNGK